MKDLLSSLGLASISDFTMQPYMIAIVVPIAALIFTGVILVCGMYFQHRRRELWHATARVALEKGQPIPEPSPDAPSADWRTTRPGDTGSRARGYLIGGLINIGIGAGMAVAFVRVAPVVSYISAIPICIGLALLLGAAIEARAERKSQD